MEVAKMYRFELMPWKVSVWVVAWLLACLGLNASPVAWAEEPDWDALEYTLMREMQAVDANGDGTWSVPTLGPPDYQQAYTLRGVVLNDPADMLDSTPDYIPCGEGTLWQLGGLWQVFIQYLDNPDVAYDDEDCGGAALWMGQNYGNHALRYDDSSFSYSDAEWTSEVEGVGLAGTLQAGGLIEVHARGGVFHKGQVKVN